MIAQWLLVRAIQYSWKKPSENKRRLKTELAKNSGYYQLTMIVAPSRRGDLSEIASTPSVNPAKSWCIG